MHFKYLFILYLHYYFVGFFLFVFYTKEQPDLQKS